MNDSRTQNTVRNAAWGIIYRLVTLLGPFAVRTIIIRKLGMEYSGLNNLFTSILTVLNLANLGFSSSLVFTMYRAVAEEDNELLCALLGFFRKVYKLVGLAILAMGLALMPFLPHLVKGECPADVNLYVLFAIYLAETSMDYLMFAYNEALFTAYQRSDVTLKISTVRYVLQYTLQCAVLLIFANYYAYIIILPLMVFPNNIAKYVAARKMYPQVVCTGTLDQDTKRFIYKKVITLFGHKVGSTVLVSIDSILISAYLGLTMSGIYGSYYLILTAVNGLVEVVTNGGISSIGNKLVTDDLEDNYRLFRTMTYGWAFLIGGAAACMLCFYQPFIGGVWLGPDALLKDGLMMLIVAYFYTWMVRIMQLTYRDAGGLWHKDWLKPYVAMILNLAGSIWMIQKTGDVSGVLIPTILIFLFVYFPWEAWVLFRHLFERSVWPYVGRMAFYTGLSLAACAVSYWLCVTLAPANTLLSLLIRIPVVAVIYPGFWWGATHRTAEYRDLTRIVRRFITRKAR